jgi:hypothetical protein
MRKILACMGVPCFLFLLGVMPAAAAEGQKKIAVLDFAIHGVEEAQAKAMAVTAVNLVAGEIARVGTYKAISSEEIKAMLNYEQQKMLLGCQDQVSCLAELGGSFGADLLVSGSISKIGTTLNISMALIDVTTQGVIMRFNRVAGDVAVLDSSIRAGVQTLLGKKVEHAGKGGILAKTVPAGAAIRIDGREAGLSPLTIDNVEPGDHLIAAKHGDKEQSRHVAVAADAVAEVSIDLASAPPVTIKILSTPPEAEVLLDDQPVGKTPLILPDVQAKSHSIALRLAGYVTHRETIQPSFDEFERSGHAAITYDIALASPFPVRPAAAAGVAMNLASGTAFYPSRPPQKVGVAFAVEAGAVLFDQFELDVGFTNPVAVSLKPRYWVLRSPFELSVLAAASCYQVALDNPAQSYWGWAISVGVAGGMSWETAIGRLGALLEVHYSFDLRHKASTVPLFLMATWRY